MSRILRNSRIGMIETGSTKKYFLYAFGETILIVLGILIALSINNANGKRNQKQKLMNIYSVIVEDIKNDTTELGDILKYYEGQKEHYDKMLSNEMSVEELKACSGCQGLAVNYQIFIPELTGYNLLRDFGGETGKDSIMLETIRAFATIEKYSTQLETAVSKDVFELIANWRDTQSWFTNVVINKDDDAYWEYLAKNKDFRNRLAHHYVLIYGNYVPRMSSFKEDLGILLNKINLLIGNELE
jgi:hypothetical protein